MKKLFLMGVMICSLGIVQAQFTKADLQASGLTCAMCSNAINKALQKVDFVEAVKPDIKSSSFAITFKAGADVDADALRKAVEDAGFFVAKLKMTGSFDHTAVDNDAHVKIGKQYFHFLNVTRQELNGEQTILLADKGFLLAKEYKKISSASKQKCLQSGKSADCCTEAGIPAGTRIYHVTI